MDKKLNELDQYRGLLKVHESFSSDAEYDNLNCLSYSKVKDVYDNPEVLFEERKKDDSEWLIFGTLVDMMLTDEEHLWDRIVVNDAVPTDQMKKISEYIVATYPTLEVIDLSDEQIEDCFTSTGSASRWTADTKRKKIFGDCAGYVRFLKTSVGKMVIPIDMYDEAEAVADVFRTNPNTKHLFMSERDQLLEHVEILYQFKIKYVLEELVCKSKIDIVYIDHDEKTINLYDIKTGSDHPRNFMRHAIYKYKYGYQSSMYQLGFAKFLEKIPELSTYKLNSFRFVYVSRIRPNYPVILNISNECNREFLSFGVENSIYAIPSLIDVFEAADYYIKQIDLGEKPYVPFDLVKSKCEHTVSSTRDSKYAFWD
jgi:hypothetical protein